MSTSTSILTMHCGAPSQMLLMLCMQTKTETRATYAEYLPDPCAKPSGHVGHTNNVQGPGGQDVCKAQAAGLLSSPSVHEQEEADGAMQRHDEGHLYNEIQIEPVVVVPDHELFSGPMLPILMSTEPSSLVDRILAGLVILLLVISVLTELGLHNTRCYLGGASVDQRLKRVHSRSQPELACLKLRLVMKHSKEQSNASNTATAQLRSSTLNWLGSAFVSTPILYRHCIAAWNFWNTALPCAHMKEIQPFSQTVLAASKS